MSVSIKTTLLSCALTVAITIPISVSVTKNNIQKQETSQNIIVNIGGEQVSFDVQKIEEISKKNSELESENQRLLEQIEQQNISPSNGNVIPDQNPQGRAVYLNELPYFNCQYYTEAYEAWESSNIPE